MTLLPVLFNCGPYINLTSTGNEVWGAVEARGLNKQTNKQKTWLSAFSLGQINLSLPQSSHLKIQDHNKMSLTGLKRWDTISTSFNATLHSPDPVPCCFSMHFIRFHHAVKESVVGVLSSLGPGQLAFGAHHAVPVPIWLCSTTYNMFLPWGLCNLDCSGDSFGP